MLEKIIKETIYEDLGLWRLPHLTAFSKNKKLFYYQTDALKNIIKVLYIYYNFCEGKQDLLNLYCQKENSIQDQFAIEYKEKRNCKINKRFHFFEHHFQSRNQKICASNFLNRACFWMATGSGKSLVIIKTIEILDHFMNLELIPKKEMMILLPREDLILQFQKEVDEFNEQRDKEIELINLKGYEQDKQNPILLNTIKVYYYRSDLLRDENKENIIDYKTYQNDGDWYVFLDEAHRGEKQNSSMQDYVTVLTKNGFLFNFSATFTDPLDDMTTCYNFNLEKFIQAGYGKNIYLSSSYFDFKNNSQADFNEREKQKQVLKSLMIFSLVKKQKINQQYHHPLLITLVNSVNTDESDLLLFFQQLEKITNSNIEENLLNEAKEELKEEVREKKQFFFGKEKLDLDLNLIENIEQKDILKQVFNAETKGKIEILEGEKGKEIVLKLETSDKPFALIKIGDANKFQKEKLGDHYQITTKFDERKIFQNINNDPNINLLLGSRSFYEGWDSNRPNVLNLINIGKGHAKKFVLQGIGRGVRIEPQKGERKRLAKNDQNKNQLLETLFIFATDKKSVKTILEQLNQQKENQSNEIEISLFENKNKPFDLLIPVYKKQEQRQSLAKFYIAQDSLNKFQSYFATLSEQTLLIKYHLSFKNAKFFIENIKNLFQIKKENVYSNMNFLLNQLLDHISIQNKVVDSIKALENEIIHFQHVKVINFKEKEIESFKKKIAGIKKNQTEEELKNLLKDRKITIDDDTEKIKNLNNNIEETFKVKIKYIAQHYYLPVIYSEQEKIDCITHIIKIESEVKFIKKLEEEISKNEFQCKWMFSKIDESLDQFYIPYFCHEQNVYRKYFPDFIFWLKQDNRYKIIFIDPKGTSYTKNQTKIDEFEKLFLENRQPKTFRFQNLEITFDLKFVTDDLNQVVGNKYKNYWIMQGDFNFLKKPF